MAPDGAAIANLESSASDAAGLAEVLWPTEKNKKRGGGGTPPGLYTATTTDLRADGYVWDGVPSSVGITIQ